MNRKEAIEKIKRAYENKELGFQRGAADCVYYDNKTDSCCAIGVLVKDESLFDDVGDQIYPFHNTLSNTIDDYILKNNIDGLFGLTNEELCMLQHRHDILIGCSSYLGDIDDEDFKKYLYSLEY